MRGPHWIGLVNFVTIFGFLTSPCAGSPPKTEQESVDAEKAVRKATEQGEVHAIGLSEAASSTFQARNVTDWPMLCETLLGGKGPAGRVVEFLPAGVLKLIAKDGVIEKLSLPFPPVEITGLKGDIAFGLHEILDRRDFYKEEVFKGMTLSQSLKNLIALGEKRTMHQTAWMNWGLLAAAFPKSISPVPPRFRTVRVQVREGKDVVLVLSCASACHWEIDVKPGGKVTGIILCGTGAQEVELIENPVEVPIVYRAYYSPDGTARIKPGEKRLLGEYDVKKDSWKKFVTGVKEITGSDFKSFQGEYRPGPKSESYLIRPSAK